MDRYRRDVERPALVKSRPIDRKILRKLPEVHKPRDFVRASKANQEEFYGSNRVSSAAGSPHDESPKFTSEEKNKIAAKILRAEMLGDAALVEHLKKQLSQPEIGQKPDDQFSHDDQPSTSAANSVLLTKTDLRTGLVYPVRSGKHPSGDQSRDRKKKKREDDKDFSMRDLLQMEKFTTAEDQLALFGATATKAIMSGKTDESWTVDDVLEENMSKKAKKKKTTSSGDSDFSRAIKDYKRHEQTLENCHFCLDSRKLLKHLIVALGLKTYLSVPMNQPLVDLQCCVVPASHVSSCVQMDEDVYDEMRIWRKGLVAMFRAQEMDVIFVESAKNVYHQPHTIIDCYPVPISVGNLAPMYFKKALLECEEEWAQNKKIVDLNKKDIRRSIPRGFSYFAVDFGLQGGYAHVIENETNFSRSFAAEIVCGMLALDENVWRRPIAESLDRQLARVSRLKTAWQPFDWTERVKERLKNE